MITSWLVVLAWVALAAILGAVAWFITDRIARRAAGAPPPAAAPPAPARQTRR